MQTCPSYTPSTLRSRPVLGIEMALREWGAPQGRPLVLLHGVQDNSITFQFLVDALTSTWRILAPDQRGHGLTGSQNWVWQQELLADLQGLLEAEYAGVPVPVVGHSMGANLALVFAALRPDLVSHVVALDALGPPPARRHHTPAQELTTFLQLTKSTPGRAVRSYADVDEMAEKLRNANPLLRADRAGWLALHSHRVLPDGRLSWPHNSNMKRSLSYLTHEGDWLALLRRIEAPVLYLASSDPSRHLSHEGDEVILQRMSQIAEGRWHRIADSSHNLHHEYPEQIAELIEGFLCGASEMAKDAGKANDSASKTILAEGKDGSDYVVTPPDASRGEAER